MGYQPATSRRALLGASGATMTALAGCSALSSNDEPNESDPRDAESPLDRIVVRSDTGETEPIRLTLVYAPPEGHTERPVWTTVDAPADGEPSTTRQGFDTGHGVYSLTAASRRYTDHAVISFNSMADASSSIEAALTGGSVQFEVVVEDTGGIWVNQGDAGDDISLPR